MLCKDLWFWRQFFIASSVCLYCLGSTMVLIFPAVLSPGLTNPNSTDLRATSEEASWIAATFGLSAMLSVGMHSYLLEAFGRRTNFMIINVMLIISWIVFVFAKNIPTLFFARAFQGIALGGMMVINLIIIEYSHPTRRGYFVSLKKTFSAIGALIIHAMTLFCDWRQVAAIAILPILLALIMSLFWPESPAYLALNGKFEECEKTFTWLHGTSVESQMELNELIVAKKEFLEKTNRKKILTQLTDRMFLKSFLLVAILVIVFEGCGKIYFQVFAIQMIIEITGVREHATYFSIAGDLLAILALMLSCFVLTIFSRRFTLFGFGGFAILLMFVCGLINLLKPAEVWLIPSVMVLHFFVINLSVVPVSAVLTGELIPLQYRALGSSLGNMTMAIFYTVLMKLTPILIQHTGVGGTYSTYGLCVLLCYAFLYFKMPETKDRTLQSIEDEILGVTREMDLMKPILGNKAV